MKSVGINSDGYYYDLDTGFLLSLEWDEYGNAYDAATGEEVTFYATADDGGPLMDNNGYVIDITNAVKDTLIGIFGRQQPQASFPTQQAPIRTNRQTGQVVTVAGSGYGMQSPPPQPQSGINISTTTLLFGVGALAIFGLGLSRGGGSRR